MVMAACHPDPTYSTAVNKCAPPDYPGLKTARMAAGADYLSSTKADISRVRDAFNETLKPYRWPDYNPESRWAIHAVRDTYLFECMNIPNGFEVENGCVLLIPTNTGTQVKRTWHLSEGGLSCATLLQLSAEYAQLDPQP